VLARFLELAHRDQQAAEVGAQVRIVGRKRDGLAIFRGRCAAAAR